MYFLTNKTKKLNKIEKIRQFVRKQGELASNLKMNITKMGKHSNLKSLC